MMRTMAVFQLAASLCEGLSNAEIASFANSGRAVTQGTANGAIATGHVSLTQSGSTLMLSSNSIPDHATANSYTQPLTAYISPQSVSSQIPNNPTIAASPTWVPGGAIGYARNGVAIYSPYSRPCTDAVVDEGIGFDQCRGHPDPGGMYHYHDAPLCLTGFQEANAARRPFFVGVMLDGFPIYNKFDVGGNEITNAQLDACHGYNPGTGYRYIVNDQFPYFTNCFTGTTIGAVRSHCNGQTSPSSSGGGMQMPQGSGQRPSGGFPGQQSGMGPQGQSPQNGQRPGGFGQQGQSQGQRPGAPGMQGPPNGPRPGQQGGFNQQGQPGGRSQPGQPSGQFPQQQGGFGQPGGQRPQGTTGGQQGRGQIGGQNQPGMTFQRIAPMNPAQTPEQGLAAPNTRTALETDNNSKSNSCGGACIGGIVGGSVLLLLVGVIAVVWWKFGRSTKDVAFSRPTPEAGKMRGASHAPPPLPIYDGTIVAPAQLTHWNAHAVRPSRSLDQSNPLAA